MRIITEQQRTKQINLYIRVLKDIDKTLKIDNDDKTKLYEIDRIMRMCDRAEKEIFGDIK